MATYPGGENHILLGYIDVGGNNASLHANKSQICSGSTDAYWTVYFNFTVRKSGGTYSLTSVSYSIYREATYGTSNTMYFDAKDVVDRVDWYFTGNTSGSAQMRYENKGNASTTSNSVTITLWHRQSTDWNWESVSKTIDLNNYLPSWTVSYKAGDATSGSAPASQKKIQQITLALQKDAGLTKSNTSHANNRTGQAITLAYNANGGTGAPANNTGTGITVPGRYSRSYAKNGWGTSSGTTTKAYAFGANYTADAAITLYPAWRITNDSTSYTVTSASVKLSSTKPTKGNSDSTGTITISYNANGGSSTPTAGTGTYTNTTPYTFNKWAAGSTSGTQYASGGTYTEKIAASKTVTMYALWTTGTTTRKSNPSIKTASAISRANSTANGTITITYNANNGSGAPSASTGTYTNTTTYTFSK